MEFDPLPDGRSSDRRAADDRRSATPLPDTSAPIIDPLATADRTSTAASGSGIYPPPAHGGSSGSVRQPPPGLDPPAARRGHGKRWRTWLIYPLLTVALAAAAGIGVATTIQRPEVAELDSFVPRLVTEVYDRNGEVVRTYSRENRILMREDDVPDVLRNAIIATEDANFMQHGGIDVKGIARASLTNVRAGRIREGASTITMQLARELFSLTREQKWWRKVEEAFLAVELEKNYSKQQILTMYANMVNLGHGNYGMEAASRAYFNKSASELTLAEAATLAGIPQRPNHFSVYRRPEEVKNRRNWVLERMLAVGFIGQEEYRQAVVQPILVSTRRNEKLIGPYFTEEARRYLMENYGANELYDRGLQVFLTLDQTIQSTAEKALRDQLLTLDHRKGWRGVTSHLEPQTLGVSEDPPSDAQQASETHDLESVSLPSWGEVPAAETEWFEGVVLEANSKTASILYRDQRLELDAKGIKWTGKKRPDQLLKRGNVAWFRWVDDDPDDDQPPTLRLEQEPEIEGAVVVLESATGAIRAMVGGWSYERNEFNRVTQAQRQVGSAFKPFVFGAALESGYTAADTVFDAPVLFPGSSQNNAYSPRNYYRKYYGIITLRKALEKSANVTAVKLQDMVGVEQVVDFAKRSGITSEMPPYPSLALGSADLIPLELAAAYAAIGNNGIYVEPYMIERITTAEGRALHEHLPRAHKAMEPTVAHVLTQMMRGVVQRGTAAGRLTRLPIESAGKTGTTNAYTDAWYAGFTPSHTILVWVGYDKKRSLGRAMTGATAALPVWADIAESGLEEGWLTKGDSFVPPSGISTLLVDANSGLRHSPVSLKGINEVFVAGSEPEKVHDQEAARVMTLPWFLQEPFYLPKEGERMPNAVDDWSSVRGAWAHKGSG